MMEKLTHKMVDGTQIPTNFYLMLQFVPANCLTFRYLFKVLN